MGRLVAAALLALALAGCGGREDPGRDRDVLPGEAWFLRVKQALRDRDADACWDTFSRGSQDLVVSLLERQIEASRGDPRLREAYSARYGVEDVTAEDARALARKILAESAGQQRILRTTYLREEREGDRIVVTFREGSEPAQQAVLVEEDGVWKVDSRASAARAGRPDPGGQTDTAPPPETSAEPFDPEEAGRACLGEGRFEDAAGYFETAMEQRPDDAGLRALRGTALARLGELDAAIADFSAAIAMEPDRAEYRRLRGQARLAQEDREGAVRDLEAALERDPGDREARRLLDEALE